MDRGTPPLGCVGPAHSTGPAAWSAIALECKSNSTLRASRVKVRPFTEPACAASSVSAEPPFRLLRSSDGQAVGLDGREVLRGRDPTAELAFPALDQADRNIGHRGAQPRSGRRDIHGLRRCEAQVPRRVQPEHVGPQCMCGLIVSDGESTCQIHHVRPPADLPAGLTDDPAQVDHQGAHGVGRERPHLGRVGLTASAAEKPATQPAPVRFGQAGIAPCRRSSDINQARAVVGPRDQDGNPRHEAIEDVADLRHVPRDFVDEPLQVVEQYRLERAEVLATEVVTPEHLAEVGIELPG